MNENVYVTRRFWEEINFTAYLASKLAGEHIESSGMGMAMLGTALTYRNEIIGQEVTAYSIMPSERAYPQKDENAYVSIKWHSHGGYDRFHSGIDYNDIALSGPRLIEQQKYRNKKLSYEIKKEDEYYILENFERKIRIKLKTDLESFIQSAEDATFEDKYVSLVINHESYDSKKPDPAKCFGEATYFEGNNVIGRNNVKLVVIEDDSKLNKMKILEDVASKIRYKGKFLKEYPDYETTKQEIVKEQEIILKENIKHGKIAKIMPEIIKETEKTVDEVSDKESPKAADYKCENASFEDFYDMLELRNEGERTFRGEVKPPVSFVQGCNEPRIEDPKAYKKRVTMEWETGNDLEMLIVEKNIKSNKFYYGLRKMAEAYRMGPSSEDQLISEIFSALSGEYVIDKKQCHNWESRAEVLDTLYKKAKNSDYVVNQIQKAIPYLESNRYLNRKKTKIAKALIRKLKINRKKRALEKIAAAITGA